MFILHHHSDVLNSDRQKFTRAIIGPRIHNAYKGILAQNFHRQPKKKSSTHNTMNPIDFAEGKIDSSKPRPLNICITFSDGFSIKRWECELKGGHYIKVKEIILHNFSYQSDLLELDREEGYVYSVSVLENVLELMRKKVPAVNGKVGCLLEAQLTENRRQSGFFSSLSGNVITCALLDGSTIEWPLNKIKSLTCHKPLYSEYRFDFETADQPDKQKLCMLIYFNGKIKKYFGGYALFSFKQPGVGSGTSGLKIKLLNMKNTPLVASTEILACYESEVDEVMVSPPQSSAKTVVAKLASNEKSTPNAWQSLPKVDVNVEKKKVATPSNEIMNKKVVPMLISPLLNESSERTGEKMKQVLVKNKSRAPSCSGEVASVPNLLIEYDVVFKVKELLGTVIDESLTSVSAKKFTRDELKCYLTNSQHYPSRIKEKIKDCYGTLVRAVQGIALTVDGFQPKDIPSICDYLSYFGIVDNHVITRFRNERNYVEHEELGDESIGENAVKTLCMIHRSLLEYLKLFLLNPNTKGGAIARFNEQFVAIKESHIDLNKRLEEAIGQVKSVIAMSEALNSVVQ